MPSPELPFFQSAPPTLRHLPIPVEPRRVDSAPGQPGRGKLRDVERRQHGESLARQITSVEQELVAIQQERIEQRLPDRVDLILELESAPGFLLSAQDIHSVTTGSRTSLLLAQIERLEDGRAFTRIVIHVPFGELSALSGKIRRFAEEQTPKGNAPHPWMANLDRIARAALKALWTDPTPLANDQDLHWWQLWLRRVPPGNIVAFEHWANLQRLTLLSDRLVLPEHIVVVAHASRAQLESSIDLLNTFAEVRAAQPCYYELTDLAGHEQAEWIEEALTRLDPPPEGSPAVCILDTGINRGHPLLSGLLAQADNHTIFSDGDGSDAYRHSNSGHGTLMAGLAAYPDLRSMMLSGERVAQHHRLEGVRIFDPARPHEPQNYGAVTKAGVYTPEIVAPKRLRTYALAITALGENDGRPSAWSAAIDAVSFGAEEEGEPKRLICVSAGNFSDHDASFIYPRHNHEQAVHDPAQAWNAITVGAITRRHQILETDPESQLLAPVAPRGSLSPFSSTTLSWEPHWPMKPEIVMEGGNLGSHPDLGPQHRSSLELLSTSADFRNRPLATTHATSAATALAANLAVGIQSAYPKLWPETIRGLVVHSARWSDTMLEGLDPHQAFDAEGRKKFIQVLRTYGFGEPHLGRAHASSQQEVTLFREDELTPYTGTAGAASINDCHVHHLRIPGDLLRSYGATQCTMRVTLSYFVAPNPSASNRIPGSRYRYAGCLLRFRVRHKDESEEDFLRRVSREAENGEEGEERPDSLYDQAWALGTKLRGKAGSLVHDVWQGNAADLASMDAIAVFPVKGWWASRTFDADSPWHHCHRRKIRYSLIVSLEAAADIPLYNAISNLISIPVEAA